MIALRLESAWMVSPSVLNATFNNVVTSVARADCNSTNWNTGRWLIGTSGRARPLTTSGGTPPAPSRAREKNTRPEL